MGNLQHTTVMQQHENLTYKGSPFFYESATAEYLSIKTLLCHALAKQKWAGFTTPLSNEKHKLPHDEACPFFKPSSRQQAAARIAPTTVKLVMSKQLNGEGQEQVMVTFVKGRV